MVIITIIFVVDDVVAQTAYDDLVHDLEPKKAEKYAKLGKLPEGHIPVLDDKIVIVQHHGFPNLTTTMGSATRGSGDEILGDIVNISDEMLNYVIIRANVYKDGKLLEHTGDKPEFIWRYDYPDELWGSNYELADSPMKASIKPGESSFFTLRPGQAGWDCYEVWIESYLLENNAKGINEEHLRQDVELQSIKIEKGILKGKIHNPTDVYLSKTMIWAQKYDENDNMFGGVYHPPGPLSPGQTLPFEIPFYIDAPYPIKTHGDRYEHEKPAHYEVSAWSITYWNDVGWDYTDKEFLALPVKFSGESNFYPDKDAAYYIDVDDLREKSSERVASSCLNDPDQVFERGDYRKSIPEWVKNNAGWWAKGKITEDDFLNGIEYLLDNMIIRTDLERQKLKFDINKDKFYFTRNSEDIVVISGWLESAKHTDRQILSCDFWHPGEIYPKDHTIKLTGSPDYKFEQNMIINQNWKEGAYKLDCEHNNTHVFSLSFDVIYGESPEEDDPVGITKVPTWIKKNAEWWANGKITEDEYLESIKFLVTNKIINIPRFVQ